MSSAQVDKQQLIEHLEVCAGIEEKKDDQRTATVLRNLIEDVEDGAFDYGVARD
ncbi:hypothetical protein ACFSR7_36380 [Cohnella sp. GCM10020058]|uniref:hypothetical protein n=1 Tax=Cohnella sp. GCM10020058 TaxID=3317330 RepID=UPI00362C206B